MKKLIPLLTAGIIIFSGLGINIGASHDVITSEELQPDVKILDILGGFLRVEAAIKNVGDQDAIIDRVLIVVDAPIMLLNKKTDLTKPVGLDAGVTIAIVSNVLLGLGPCTVTYTMDIRNHGQVTASANGFIFGIYIVIKEVFPST